MLGFAEALKIVKELVAKGLLEDYAIGGGIAALFYVDPVITHDLDVFCLVNRPPSSLNPFGRVFAYLMERGYAFKGDQIMVGSIPLQLLPDTSPLVKNAITKARTFIVEGLEVKVVGPEHLLAMALETGRRKDIQRAINLHEEARLDREYLQALLAEYGLEEKWRSTLATS